MVWSGASQIKKVCVLLKHFLAQTPKPNDGANEILIDGVAKLSFKKAWGVAGDQAETVQ